MIRTRNALSRQVQDFFHSHLLGLYRWDDVDHAPAQKVDRIPGKSLEAGKTHDKIEMRFGPFDLTVFGPFEDDRHPCGLIKVQTGAESLEGPLDPATWVKVSDFIKTHNHEEIYNGSTARDDWGR